MKNIHVLPTPNPSRIISSNKEPKQELRGIPAGTINMVIGKPKQETLEEVAKNYINMFNGAPTEIELFIEGAKWMQERMYSEEEVLEIIRQYALEEHLITSSKPDIWFNKFKKK